ncbi:hypothetical protein Tco_1094570 [Tanacetum coccineum]|uniref:Uncharacterized protein n=1 Tax=Tanacetum coccineum TaxID=301880 RepID=A0ABQ5II96_9ASTR
MPIGLGSVDVIIGDETLTLQSNMSDGYASIVASKQSCLIGLIRYHPGKASVAADVLSRNERAEPLRVRALVMTINSNLPPQIHEARVEALKKENVKDENLHGMDKEFKNHLDGTLCIRRRSWLPRVRDLGELIQHNMHHHLCQQVLDVFKDEGLLSEAIQSISTTRNIPLEMGRYSRGFFIKLPKETSSTTLFG